MKKTSQVEKTGELPFTVNKEVVSHLSIGLYRNFARAVKELISNSYDAGATEVKIKLDLNKAEIIVRDNGRGMDIKDISAKYLKIGYVTPSSDKVDELGRKRVGTFGIGCLSVFSYCKTLNVITKKRDSNDIIDLDINTESFFKGMTSNLDQEKATYVIHKSDLPKGKGETIITLKGIKPHLIKELKHSGSLGRSSIDKFSGYQKFKWTLSQYSPLQFSPEIKELKIFFSNAERTPMRTWLDGKELFRNVPEDTKILEKGKEKFGDVSLKYVIMTPMRPIEPKEARGLQVRLRDIAVGLPTDFDVTSLRGKVLGKLNYLCGEVHILEGLDNSLMINRDSFSYTESVAEIQEFFRNKLTKWNESLENWASEDKEVYSSLLDVKGSETVLNDLKSAGIIRFSKERLRLSKSPVVGKKKKEIASPIEKIKKVLSKKGGYKVISKKLKAPGKKSAIEVKPKEKSIIVYEEHPDLAETVKIENKTFKVDYGKWDIEKTPYAICKFADGKNKVIFNSSHPLFESRISDEVIKRLSLGILLITKDRKDKEEIVVKFNRLLEDVFIA